jgi:hypothetical protein
VRSPRAGTIYDALRMPVGWNGAIKSPSPQSERPIAASSLFAGMDTSALGQVDTTARHSRTYTGGELQPQGDLMRPPADFQDISTDAGVAMNARAANPSRGLSAGEINTGKRTHRPDPRRRRTPMAKRR